MDIVDRLKDPEMYVDAIDDAIREIVALRARPQTTPVTELDVRWQELVKMWDEERRKRQRLWATLNMLEFDPDSVPSTYPTKEAVESALRETR